MSCKLFSLWFVVLAFNNVMSQLSDNSILFAEDSLEASHGKIIHASVLFRHGPHTPYDFYPSLEFEASIWPEGLGQLTKEGKQLLYGLGKWLRERYKNTPLLAGYNYNTLRMDSSDVDRTLMSAELVLSGLLPPNAEEVWSEDGPKWQPIPVHTIPQKTNQFFPGMAICPRYFLERDMENDSPRWQNYYSKNQEVIEYVAKNIGRDVSQATVILSMLEVAGVYTTLSIFEHFNKSIPTWAKTVYPEPMGSVNSMSLFSRLRSQEMHRLITGPLLGSMVTDMVHKKSGLSNQTLHLYSGFETNIASLLITLDAYDLVVPDYGASIMLELRQKNDEYFVTMMYRNETTSPPYAVILPNCGQFCTLKEFVEITKPIIPDNWAEECTIGFWESIFNSTVVKVIGILLIIALLVAIIAFIIRKKPWETCEGVGILAA